MAVKSIRRGPSAGGNPINFASRGTPPYGSNDIYVDGSADTLVFSTGTSGSSSKTVVDTTSTQTLTNKTLTSPTISTTSAVAANTSTVSAAYAADTYLAGSGVTIPTSGVVVGSTYECLFDMVKTGAGTATPIVTVRYGTAGTTADAALVTFTFAAGTAVADTGLIWVRVHFQTVGSGTSAVVVGACELSHLLAATGLTSTGAAGVAIVTAQTSAGFNSTPAGSIMGVSFNGGASFSGTTSVVEANLRQV